MARTNILSANEGMKKFTSATRTMQTALSDNDTPSTDFEEGLPTEEETPGGEGTEEGDENGYGNWIVGDRDDDDFPLAPVDSKELGLKQDRFAIIPLYTKHYKYALNGEYMIDENTGAPGIKLPNGRIVMDGEEGRLRYHIAMFESELGYYGMRKAVIKQAYYDDDSYIHLYKSGTNLLDDPVYIDDQKKIKKLCISLDLDIFEDVEESPKMKIADIDPDVIVRYTIDMGKRQEYQCKLSTIKNTIEEMTTISLAINQIIMPSDLGCVLEKCHIIVHSILIGVIEEEL